MCFESNDTHSHSHKTIDALKRRLECNATREIETRTETVNKRHLYEMVNDSSTIDTGPKRQLSKTRNECKCDNKKNDDAKKLPNSYPLSTLGNP